MRPLQEVTCEQVNVDSAQRGKKRKEKKERGRKEERKKIFYFMTQILLFVV